MTPALRTALERAGITDFRKSSAQVARALDKVLEEDPELRRDVERDLEIRKALSRPYADFGGLGGTRHMSVPLFEAGASDADADVERAAAALGILSAKLRAITKVDVEAARRDEAFRPGRGGRGATFTKGGGTAERLASDLQEIVDALNTPVDY